MKRLRWARGFTIIEVLIVLAIAGLILLVVFLAVPALQRNARNTQRKHDAALISAAINGYKTDNSSNAIVLPDEVWTDAASAQKVDIGSSSTLYTEADLGFYNSDQSPDTTPGPKAGDIVINPSSSVGSFTAPNVKPVGFSGVSFNNITENSVAIISGEECADQSGTTGNPVNNSVAVFYVLETGSGNGSLQCLNA